MDGIEATLRMGAKGMELSSSALSNVAGGVFQPSTTHATAAITPAAAAAAAVLATLFHTKAPASSHPPNQMSEPTLYTITRVPGTLRTYNLTTRCLHRIRHHRAYTTRGYAAESSDAEGANDV